MDYRMFMDDLGSYLRRVFKMSKHTKEAEAVSKCNAGGDCCEADGKVTEDQIREQAYYLWEQAGGVGDPEHFWSEAKKKLCKK